jgi:Phytanoyl-CoA dioxygenase (PhyH)
MHAKALLRPAIWSYSLQRACTWYPLRRFLSTALAKTKPAHVAVDPVAAKRVGAELERNGIAMLPDFVAPDAIARIKAHLEGAQLSERFPPCRKNFDFDSIPENVHVAEYTTEHILRCPDVVGLANHPLLLDCAAEYLGCKPTISNISIWWSLPADGSAQEAENYHRDVDEWRFVKFFLYLTDADEMAGPHCFVRGSHRSTRFLRIRRIRDAEVKAAFAESDQLRICGRAGDAFLEDTFGLHKGQPPTAKNRLLFQVEYSINPIAVYRYSPSRGSGVARVDNYVNRLYIAQP